MSDDNNKVENPQVRFFNEEDKRRLRELIKEGISVNEEIDVLKKSLTDTIEDIGKEMDIKPAQLKKAISIAHKANLSEQKDKMQEVEDILRASGRIS